MLSIYAGVFKYQENRMMKILLTVLLIIKLASDNTVQACGGCSTCLLTDVACVPTEVRIVKLSSTNGWWWNKKTKYSSVYQYYKGTPYCCAGYTLSGTTCSASALNCGGCDNTDISSEPACTQYVQQKQSRLTTVSFSCSSWWWMNKTCYRKDTFYELVRLNIHTCCAGFILNGATCIKDASPPPCGQSKYLNPGLRNTFIVGGTQALQNEFPWQLRLSMSGTGLCGATLVGAEWALTAAHCVKAYINNPTAIAVVAGDHRYNNYDSTEQLRYVSSVFVHTAYSTATYENDIAIIRLNAPVILSDDVAIACLPLSCDENYDEASVIISGWGRSSAGDKESTIERLNELQFAWMTVKAKSYCERFFGPLETFVCTSDSQGDTERSPCFGDSGGPMALKGTDGRFTVIGVASFVADRGCAQGLPSGYTDVRPYLRWIKQIMF